MLDRFYHRDIPSIFGNHPVLAAPAGTPTAKSDINTGTGTGTGTGAATDTGTGTGTGKNTGTGGDGVAKTGTSDTAKTTATTDSGLLGGLLPPISHSTATSTSSITPTVSPSPSGLSSPNGGVVSTTQTTTDALTPPPHSGPSGRSTVFDTLTSTPSSTPPPPSLSSDNSANPDAGPIAGGVIGGIFAVAAIGMFISFLLRRRRRKQIDREIFGTLDFAPGAATTGLPFEEPKDDGMSQRSAPRPPSMFERRVGTPGVQAPQYDQRGAYPGVPPPHSPAHYVGGGGYGHPPGYPPPAVQMGYYPHEQPPYSPHSAAHFQPGYGNNHGHAYNVQLPPRAHTPQMAGGHPEPGLYGDLPNPFTRNGGGASVDGLPRESSSGEELPSYGYGFDGVNDDFKYADLQRDAKPRPDSVDGAEACRNRGGLGHVP